MTTPQQPGADPQDEARAAEDLELPADTQLHVAGGDGGSKDPGKRNYAD